VPETTTQPVPLGIVGSVIAALGCATPILVMLFGAVGLRWLAGYLDYVLLPALVWFLSLMISAMGHDGDTIGRETP
jgi:mercuric ion transport protein